MFFIGGRDLPSFIVCKQSSGFIQRRLEKVAGKCSQLKFSSEEG